MQDTKTVGQSTGLPIGENTNTVMSDKDKEVARCKVRDAKTVYQSAGQISR